MQSILLGLAVLACPVGMGVMMWMMGRVQRKGGSETGGQQQVTQLRAELDQLKCERARQGTKGER